MPAADLHSQRFHSNTLVRGQCVRCRRSFCRWCCVQKKIFCRRPANFFALSSPLASKGPKDWGASPNQRVSIQKGPPVQGQVSTPKTIKSRAENRVSWKCSKARPSRIGPQKCAGQHSINSALPMAFGYSSGISSNISPQYTHGPKLSSSTSQIHP